MHSVTFITICVILPCNWFYQQHWLGCNTQKINLLKCNIFFYALNVDCGRIFIAPKMHFDLRSLVRGILHNFTINSELFFFNSHQANFHQLISTASLRSQRQHDDERVDTSSHDASHRIFRLCTNTLHHSIWDMHFFCPAVISNCMQDVIFCSFGLQCLIVQRYTSSVLGRKCIEFHIEIEQTFIWLFNYCWMQF